MRVNYVNGDYETDDTSAPQRGADGGDVELDTFRLNLGMDAGPFEAKAEYRWYTGVNFIHTLYGSYSLNDVHSVQLGLCRVPFGVGPYGPSNSWFFDQHYYVGLADDMDVGIKYRADFSELSLDLAYFAQSEPSGNGASVDSARYSYDAVSEEGGYAVYNESHQLNARAVYTYEGALTAALGISGQWERLDADNATASDTDAYAAAVHAKLSWHDLVAMIQGTRYDYSPVFSEESGLSSALLGMGAYDFAWPVASRGTIPSLALSYTVRPESITWIDSLKFYNDFSVILKDDVKVEGVSLNDSTLNVLGVAIARGGWYIFADYAYSDGNFFVGNEGDDYSNVTTVHDFGVNGNNRWMHRFNINVGFYF